MPSSDLLPVTWDMVLWQQTYLYMPKARSRAGGFYFLSDRPALPLAASTSPPKHDGAINVLCQTMREVLNGRSRIRCAFYNAKKACPIRIALEELGHTQIATPLQTVNITAAGIANDTVKHKQSNSNGHATLLAPRSLPTGSSKFTGAKEPLSCFNDPVDGRSR